jgi:hypothetical protein
MFSYLFSCLKWSPFRAEPSIAMKLWTKSHEEPEDLLFHWTQELARTAERWYWDRSSKVCLMIYTRYTSACKHLYMRCPYNDLCRYSMSKEWVSVVRARLAEDGTSCAERKEGVQPGVGSFWEMVLIWYALIDIRRF